VTKPRDEWTAEQWRKTTEGARRRARFKYAQDRIRKIAQARPPFTDEELSQLAVLLHPEAGQ
jgi:hypothetical protein